MKICLLTYDAPHKKTAQVFMGLHNRGWRNIDFLLMPFSPRPERDVLIRHRPPHFEGLDPRSLAGLSAGEIFPYHDWQHLVDRYDHFIVCGSNLIEPAFANSGKILNVHAGLIPHVRGLDSFKWAILKGYPLGNTLHVIDADADAGRVLAHLVTPVFAEGDLMTLAMRHYENEIWMLGHFDTLLDGRRLDLVVNRPTMRMSREREAHMVRAFESYKHRYADTSA